MEKFTEFKDVVKSYKVGDITFNSLSNISFSMPRGGLACILGPSGAAKSIIFNIFDRSYGIFWHRSIYDRYGSNC